METITASLSDIKVPQTHNRIYKDECVLSFDNPESEHGLYICLKTFLGFGRKYVEDYHRRTGTSVFLHLKRTRKPVQNDIAEVPEKVSRLAIGVEGGFNPEARNYEVEEEKSVTVMPGFVEIPLTDPGLPLAVQLSVAGIMSMESATHKQELEDAAGTWDGEKLEESKFAKDLKQLDNGVKVPPKGWKCARCDLTSNLWLNLTDGTVLCGRKFFDGSGGNNHAVEYYQETKYPLCVKLGTISKDGKADVFSYAEDNMVEDPYLAQHLAHFGINIKNMEKTDKSMVEIEIDMNQRIGEWATLTESGSKLVPVFGAGYTGMANLGNTCYMNSVMQVLFNIPTFQSKYTGASADQLLSRVDYSSDMAANFNVQMAKLGNGLWSGEYAKPPKDGVREDADANEMQPGIKPVMFKNLIGKGHPEFSGKQQQDAQEFYLHFLTIMERQNRGEVSPGQILQFEVEDRIECATSGKVRYMTRVEDYLPLPIPVAAAVNKEEVAAYTAKKAEAESRGETMPADSLVRPKIPFDACIQAFCDEELVPDFYSSAIKAKTTAKKTMRLNTFPDYLLIQLKKFDVDANWMPYKLDVEVGMPDEISLDALRSKGGIQPGEVELPVDAEEPPKAEAAIVPDQAIVQQLMEMGFSAEGCKKAAFHTKNTGVEAAMNWVMEHMGDPDFNDPFVAPGAQTAFVPNEESLAMVMSMGFSKDHAAKALKNTDNNVERAVEWIFSHPDDASADDGDTGAASNSAKLTDGVPKYRLNAFISHMGTSTMVGHYVCHILKDGKWVIFNDNKVALSEKPPKELGYLYLYKRQ